MKALYFLVSFLVALFLAATTFVLLGYPLEVHR